MNQPLDTAQLLAFTQAVTSGSLSRAAAELGAPRATIGRRLALLEERLGVRLLRRTTRSLALTDAGAAFYRHARAALDAVAQAEESVNRSDGAVRGTLRVSVPPLSDPAFFGLICEFARQYPDVVLQLDFSSRIVNLRREGYDVALRATAALEPGLVRRTLARATGIAVAAPSYLAAHGTPRSARNLRTHRCLLGFARGELPETHWPLARGGRVRIAGSFFANELTLLCEAALRGLGIALLPLLLVERWVASGALVHVLRGVIEADTRVSLVYPEREFVPPQVRAFVAAIAGWVPTQTERATSPTPAAAKRGRSRGSALRSLARRSS